MGVTCFYVERKEPFQSRRSLRRYSMGKWDVEQQKHVHDHPCVGSDTHDASVPIEDGFDPAEANTDAWPRDDPRWPLLCEKCAYVFRETDNWQMNAHPLYVSKQREGEWTLRDRIPGMMWNAHWMSWVTTTDGLCLVVVLPGGHQWMIDGPASNCDRKDDNAHRCWIRHGTPPLLTVDKAAGTADASAMTTCGAGAGSILAGDYHGFLRNGSFDP